MPPLVLLDMRVAPAKQVGDPQRLAGSGDQCPPHLSLDAANTVRTLGICPHQRSVSTLISLKALLSIRREKFDCMYNADCSQP
jgi:hypothetical protein